MYANNYFEYLPVVSTAFNRTFEIAFGNLMIENGIMQILFPVLYCIPLHKE